MKKIRNMLLSFLVAPTLVLAGDGNGIIPYWQKTTQDSTEIYVTNISNSSVTVNITLYDENGNVYDESSETGTNFVVMNSFSGDPLSTSGATLDANETGRLFIDHDGTSQRGYGVISWSSSGKETVALIAHSRLTTENFTTYAKLARTVYPINNHEPF